MAESSVFSKRKMTGMDKGNAGEQTLFNEGFTLDIQHVPTGASVSFSAFVDSFSDAYNSEWSSEQVYGRMDPIPTFQNTRRALAVSWIVPASSIAQAKENMDEINALLTFLYPLYSDPVASVGSSAVVVAGSNIIQGPLVRVKFGNLIQDAATGGGLLGYLNGFTMDPQLDMGMFMIGKDQKTGLTKPLGTSDVEYLPKAIKLNFELNVLHEHSLGWVRTSDGYAFRGGGKGFPYATNNPVPVHTDAATISVYKAKTAAKAAKEKEVHDAQAQARLDAAKKLVEKGTELAKAAAKKLLGG